jgi:hypothetical protein
VIVRRKSKGRHPVDTAPWGSYQQVSRSSRLAAVRTAMAWRRFIWSHRLVGFAGTATGLLLHWFGAPAYSRLGHAALRSAHRERARALPGAPFHPGSVITGHADRRSLSGPARRLSPCVSGAPCPEHLVHRGRDRGTAP